MHRRSIPLLLACGLALAACGEDDVLSRAGSRVAMEELLDGPVTLELNPSGLCPLAAVATFQTRVPVHVSLEVLGEDPLGHDEPGLSTHHEVPILGLYPGTVNRIELRLVDAELSFAVDTLELSTDALPEGFPTIEVVTADRWRMEDGWTLSSLSLAGGGRFVSWPVMFDASGEVRWYLDLSFLDDLVFVVKRAANGNLIFGEGSVLYEYDMLGRQLRRWDIPGYTVHHELLEKPDGNLLAAVNVVGRGTVGDQVIEVDRHSGAIVAEWDLRQVLDVYRRTYVDNVGDWLHMNAVWYSAADDALIISGRNQSAVVKVTRDNELLWILGPQKDWGLAGVDANGHDTSEFLLTAVDAAGVPYSEAVQQGDEDAPDFRWPWGQHAPMILPNGHLFVFDNGLTRNFDADAAPFSRGVEYEIDESAMTVRQVWQYGEERGPDYYSVIISDVDLLPSTGNRLIMPGSVRGSDPRAYVTEVSYPGKHVVFEAVIHFKNLAASGSFGWGDFDLVYRSERLSPYPHE
jgi:arylsulfate sulfotransferase